MSVVYVTTHMDEEGADAVADVYATKGALLKFLMDWCYHQEERELRDELQKELDKIIERLSPGKSLMIGDYGSEVEVVCKELRT